MIFILFNCSVTDEGIETATNSAPISKFSKLSEEENKECELWRSYQYDYFKNSRNYRRTIYCNMEMMQVLGCDASNEHKPNYYNLARSFIELDPNANCDDTETIDINECGCIELGNCADSAFWALKQGLKINKNDVMLVVPSNITSRVHDDY